jgi:hypothetical protein
MMGMDQPKQRPHEIAHTNAEWELRFPRAESRWQFSFSGIEDHLAMRGLRSRTLHETQAELGSIAFESACPMPKAHKGAFADGASTPGIFGNQRA